MNTQMGIDHSDNQSLNQYDDSIDLRDLFGALWSGKLIIISITAIFAVGSVMYALSIPNQYKAEVLLAPAQSDGGGLSGSLGQLGGIASLAGVKLGGGETGEAVIAQKVMKSWSFIESFISENDIAFEVFAVQGWVRESNTLETNKNVYDLEKNEWLLVNEDDSLGPPSSWQLFQSFSRRLSIAENKATGLVLISFEYYSPRIAKRWLDLYVEAINLFMQQRKVAKVTRNIAYLEEQIAKTTVAEMQEVFYKIIEEQTKNKMLAAASPDYAFTTISSSMVPEQKSKPMRAIICILGTLLGGMLSVLLVLVMHHARKSD